MAYLVRIIRACLPVALVALLIAWVPTSRGAACRLAGRGCANCTANGRHCTACSRGFFQAPGRGPLSWGLATACRPCSLQGCVECAACWGRDQGCLAGRRCARCDTGYALSPDGTCIPDAPCLDDADCLRCARDGSCAECRAVADDEPRYWYRFLSRHGACATEAAAEKAALTLLTAPCGYQQFQTVLPTGLRMCSPCPSDCPHSLRSPSVCIPSGTELEASFGLKPVDLASLGSLLVFQNSSQSAEATCVLALTSSTSQGCGPGRFLVTYSATSRACYNCKTGRKAAPSAGSLIVNTPGTPDPCPGCAPRAYCSSCFACSGGPFCKYRRQCQCAAGTFFDARPTSKSAGICVPCTAIRRTCRQCQSCGPLYASKCVNGGLCQPP